MPALVLTKSRLRNETDIIEGIYKLYSKDERVSLEKGKIYQKFIAEVVFEKFKDKDFVKGVQIDFNDDSGKMRYELWNTSDLLLVYEYTNIGSRLLRIFDIDQTNITIGQLDIVKSHYEQHAKITFFSTLEERDML